MTEKEYLELVAPPDSYADIIESYILDNKLDLVNEYAYTSQSTNDNPPIAQKRISRFYFYKNCGDANLVKSNDENVETPTSKITLDISSTDTNFEFDFFRLWICINDFSGDIDTDISIDLYHSIVNNEVTKIPENSYKIIKRRLDNRLIICIFRNERTVRYVNNELTKISILTNQASSICGVIF